MLTRSNYYNKITIFENHRRVSALEEFSELVNGYFDNIEYTRLMHHPIENQRAQDIRSQINLRLKKASKIINLVGVPTSFYYSPPPAIGGLAANIELLANIFNLYQYRMGRRNVLDCIDQAVGVYNDDRTNSILRTISPFFWIGMVFNYLVSLPFVLLGKVGFDRSKIEENIIGKIAKTFFHLIIGIASFLTILHLLGYLENFRSLINNLIKVIF